MIRSAARVLLPALLLASRLPAQEEAVVEQLALVLAAEDARDFQPAVFEKALVAPDSLVRRLAATGAGRIGDLRATSVVLPLLLDPDSTVRVAAAFALGLLRDTAAVQPLIDRLIGQPALDGPTAFEAMTALAKIGGARVGQFFRGVLSMSAGLTSADQTAVVDQALLESWRLAEHAPVGAILPFADDTTLATRWRAAYALGRLRAPAAGERLTLLLRDSDAFVRSLAARALTRQYADTAELAPGSVAELLARAAVDPNPQVRINGLRSLAGFGGSPVGGKLTSLLQDPLPHVQVQAAATLGELGGAEAVRSLARVAGGKGNFAVRREALIGLARADTAAYRTAVAPWRSAADWRQRAAAAEAEAIAGPGAAPWFLSDRDGRVVAAGLQAWGAEVEGADGAFVAAARPLLAHPDAAVRSVAADAVGRAAALADLPALVQTYRRTGRDSFPEAALSALGAILAVRNSGTQAQARVDREFLAGTDRPADYLIRRWAEENWPEAAARWGPAYPIATGRTVQDYRDLVRRFVIGPDSITRPRVKIETEQRLPVEIELLGPDAPLTVANFLRLVRRRFFDGNRWHRVVPNFVVQDGDPRGDGFGGPGGSIRDEINRHRYDRPMLGMALSGPDTGSSQWFINLSPQPHLDGTYTVFGRVVGGNATLARITQGDVIRTVGQ
jgi:cyclophilin family peptidyl-prolyl cis-trans isomerase/HEAT repeat protein